MTSISLIRDSSRVYRPGSFAENMAVSLYEMICCGDGYNDVSMIEYAGLGVAMGNAQPAVKDSADFVTRTNDEDGILHVINLFMRD